MMKSLLLIHLIFQLITTQDTFSKLYPRKNKEMENGSLDPIMLNALLDTLRVLKMTYWTQDTIRITKTLMMEIRRSLR